MVSRGVLADPEVGPGFYKGLAELAVKARAWDVIAAILEKPNGKEIVANNQSALDQIAKELEAEQSMIVAIKSSLSAHAK
jgi:hypothetical protein